MSPHYQPGDTLKEMRRVLPNPGDAMTMDQLVGRVGHTIPAEQVSRLLNRGGKGDRKLYRGFPPFRRWQAGQRDYLRQVLMKTADFEVKGTGFEALVKRLPRKMYGAKDLTCIRCGAVHQDRRRVVRKSVGYYKADSLKYASLESVYLCKEPCARLEVESEGGRFTDGNR